MRHGRVQILIETGIVHKETEATLSAVQLLGELLCTIEGSIHTVECTLHIEARQIRGEPVGIVENAIRLLHHTRNLLVQSSHQGIQLTGGNGEVAGEGRHIVEGSSQGRICQECIHTGEDGIQLRQHLLNNRNHFGSLAHHTVIHGARDDAARFDTLTRIIGKQETNLEISHDILSNLCGTTCRDSQILVDIHLDLDGTLSGIVEIQLIHGTHLVAIGIDRGRSTHTLDVIKRHIVGVIGREQVDAFQKVDSEIHHQDTYNSDQRYPNFLCQFHIVSNFILFIIPIYIERITS